MHWASILGALHISCQLSERMGLCKHWRRGEGGSTKCWPLLTRGRPSLVEVKGLQLHTFGILCYTCVLLAHFWPEIQVRKVEEVQLLHIFGTLWCFGVLFAISFLVQVTWDPSLEGGRGAAPPYFWYFVVLWCTFCYFLVQVTCDPSLEGGRGAPPPYPPMLQLLLLLNWPRWYGIRDMWGYYQLVFQNYEMML